MLPPNGPGTIVETRVEPDRAGLDRAVHKTLMSIDCLAPAAAIALCLLGHTSRPQKIQSHVAHRADTDRQRVIVP
jgi:hypothetical protein